jgi:hypothetical protein
MTAVVRELTSLPDAIAELELAAALVLLAEQEREPLQPPLSRLRDALAQVHASRALAVELAGASGKPALRVAVGGYREQPLAADPA